MMDVLPIFRLRFVPNVGVSLGLLPANSEAARWALVVLTAGIAIGVAIWMLRERNRADLIALGMRSEEHTSELQSLMRISYAVFCLKKKKTDHTISSRKT